jgi:hypothetical protein
MDGIKEQVEKIVVDWSEDVIQQMKERVPRASSQLFQSISPLIETTSQGLKLQLIMEEYWEDADLGVGKSDNPKADMPMMRKRISDWIDVKPELKAQIKAEGGDFISHKNSAVFLISRSILNHGTKQPPSFFFSEVLGDIPLNPPSDRRVQTSYPQGMGKWDELKEALAEAFRGGVVIELKE